MPDINSVNITCRLTRDVEVRHTAAGDAVASLRVAVNNRRKVNGEWVDAAHFVDVTLFGKVAETAAQYLGKGRRCGISGRLDWQEWETQDGQKRQALRVVGNEVVFLDSREDSAPPAAAAGSDLPTSSPAPAAASSDDDIPF